MQWRAAPASLVGTTDGLAIDGHHPGKLDPVGFGECCHEASEGFLERLRVQSLEYTAERVVAGNAVLEYQEFLQQLSLRAAKQRHVCRTFGSAQDRGQRNDKNIEQIVQRIGRARIGQTAEDFAEFAHRNPLAIRESSSESISLPAATPNANPHAIPLPSRGG